MSRNELGGMNWAASWHPHAASSTRWQDVNPISLCLELVVAIVESDGDLWQVQDINAMYHGHRYKLVCRDEILSDAWPWRAGLRPFAPSTMRDTPEQLVIQAKAELRVAEVVLVRVVD